MPGSKLNKGDIFDDSFFQALKDADKQLKDLLITFQNLAKEARDVSKGISAAKSFNEVSKAAKKAAESTTKLTDAEKKLEAANKRLIFEQSEAAKKMAVVNELKRQSAAENRKLAKSIVGVEQNTNRWGKAIGSFQFKFNALGNIAANVVQRIARGIGRAIRGAIKNIAEFDQAVADVGAISNATDRQLAQLEKTALQLGGSTKFTATEVAGLQKELAKLGFTTSEILSAQSAILDLAAAAQTDLANAAEIAGITVNQFGLQAKDTQRVVDVMAKSFTTSALDVDKFSEAMKFVGPAAKASGVSIEQTTAYLAQLADAGISGSMAGTSLRQIMLALSKESGTFGEKMQRAAEKGLDLAGASDEVQRRAATAFLVLNDGADDLDKLTESFENAGGAAKELAEKQLDTLTGQMTILTSAWNRFLLSVTRSESKFKGIKSILGGFSNILNNWVDASEAMENLGGTEAQNFLDQFLGQLSEKDYAGQVAELTGEIKFIKSEMNNYSQELSEANYQLANTKKREKEVREEWNQRKVVAEGMLRIYGKYLTMLQDVQIEDVVTETAKEAAKLPGVLTEAMLKFTKEEQQIWDDIQREINASFGIFAPMTAEELELMNELVQANADFMNEEMARKRQEFDDESLKNTVDRVEKEIAEEQRLVEAVRMAEEMKQSLKADIANEGFNFLAALNERKMADIDRQLKAELISEEQAEKEKMKLRKRAAVIDKAQALFNIALNTAIGVSNAAAKTITIPLIPFIIGLGAAQAAVVLAQPIPAFEKGTESAPGGLAVVSEKGSELMIGPDGKIGLTPSNESLMNIDKGTKIFPADVTKEIMKYAAVATGLGSRANDSKLIVEMMARIDDSTERLRRELKNKPVSSSILTPAGILTSTYKGNTVIKKMNKFFG